MKATTAALVLAAATAAIALTATAPARADDAPPQQALGDPAAEARRQFNLGTKAFEAKRFAEAAQSFEAAASYKAHAVTLYTAALAWEQAGRPDRAADDYARALAVPGAGLNAEQDKNARDHLAQLERQLGTLSVNGPEGTRVQLDALTEVAVPAQLHGMPGPHALSYKLAGKATADEKDVTLDAGKSATIDLAAESAAAEAATARSSAAASGSSAGSEKGKGEESATGGGESAGVKLRRSLGLVAMGVGVAGLGATAMLGIEGLGARDAFNETPTRTTFDHAQSLQTWTNVFLVGGSVFLVGGAVLYFLPAPAASASLKVGVVPAPGGAGVRGQF